MKISVVGLGKLGSPIVAVLASKGFDVIGFDIDPQVVAKMAAAIAPVEEPFLQELLTGHKARISATTSWVTAISESDATFIIVPTPSGHNGAFKNDHVLDAVENIARVLKSKKAYHLVVVNATTMPGSIGGPIQARLEAVSGKHVGPELGLCYNPEFIALGDVVQGLLHPDFVLIGEADSQAGDMLEGIYRQIHGPAGNIARMNLVNAELTKISVNTYVTTKISFANMLSEICDNLPDADVDVITRAIGKDTRIGPKYLRGATGYGGPCFPRDTVAFATMAQSAGVKASIAEATHEINERQSNRLLTIVKDRTSAKGTVAILGLAYKPGTPVIERSQAIELAAGLTAAGFRVTVYDPLAMPAAQSVLGSSVKYANDLQTAVKDADTIAIMLPVPEFSALTADGAALSRVKLIVDCWRCLDARALPDHIDVIQLGNFSSLHNLETADRPAQANPGARISNV